MNILKKTAGYVFCGGYMFGSTYMFPMFLLIAFNWADGICINPDGEMFIPIGVLLSLAVLVLDFLLIRKIVVSKTAKCAEKILLLVTLVALAAVATVCATREWKLFFHCAAWHLEH